MQDAEYHALVDALFYDLEDKIDNMDQDVEIDSEEGVLNIVFPNGTTIVISRQIGNHEVWIAAKSGGYHLSREENNWRCKATGETLMTLLNRVISEQLYT